MTSFWTPPLLNLSSADISSWNEALSFCGQPISLGDGRELTFLPATAPAYNVTVAILKIANFTQPIAISIHEFAFDSLFNIELSLATLDLLPSGLQQALYEGMVSWICDKVAPQSQKLWQLEALQLFESISDPADINAQWFEVVLVIDTEVSVKLALRLHLGDAAKILRDQSLGPVPLQSIIAQGIRASADFTIGLITVTHQELQSLIPGSIVVMALRETGTCQLRADDVLFTFVSTDDGWCCVDLGYIPGSVPGGIRHRIGDAGTMQDSSPETERSISTHELRITLVFDIGRKQVPFSELSQWREGALISLDPPIATEGLEVTIRANGDAIGTGDLVKIDDRVAVRITRLLV